MGNVYQNRGGGIRKSVTTFRDYDILIFSHPLGGVGNEAPIGFLENSVMSFVRYGILNLQLF
jgi:hypothetical protein